MVSALAHRVGGVGTLVPESPCAYECACKIYLMLLLLLLTQVATVGVVFDNFLAHVIHSVHEQLKALLQVIAAKKKYVFMSFKKFLFGQQKYKTTRR